MRPLFRNAALCALLFAQALPSAEAGSPRKGISYKPTPDGGRACYVDGVFAYPMPQVPKGLWGTTYGVTSTPALADGPTGETDWIPYLRTKGMNFLKGTSATFHAAYGHLVVVNTREQHAVLMKLAGLQPPE